MNIVKFLLHELPNESSKNRKIELLQQYESTNLKEILKFVFNPLIITGISKAKLRKKVPPLPKEELITFDKIYDVMNYLEKNNTGTDKVIANIQNFLNSCLDDEERLLAEKIITKDLQIGATAALLNKAYGNTFIPKFDVQKAESYFKQKKPLDCMFIITEKLDGIRALAFKYSQENIVFYSRSGKEIKGLEELKESMAYLPEGYVYDGELLALNPEHLESKDLFAKTSSIVNSKGEKKGITHNIFDMLPISEFNNGQSTKKSYERFKDVIAYVTASQIKMKNCLLNYPFVYYVGEDENAILPLLNEVTAQGKEGLMISKANGFYKTKRTKDLLKVKKMQTVDLRVIGYEEHKNGDKLGALIVDYKGNPVNVGSGFTDKDRYIMWENIDSYIGKIVEVQYFEETKNKKDDSLSLRFPVFIRVRNDKDEVSYH